MPSKVLTESPDRVVARIAGVWGRAGARWNPSQPGQLDGFSCRFQGRLPHAHRPLACVRITTCRRLIVKRLRLRLKHNGRARLPQHPSLTHCEDFA